MKKYQAVGIGNAIVDVISQADDSFLKMNKILRECRKHEVQAAQPEDCKNHRGATLLVKTLPFGQLSVSEILSCQQVDIQ